MSQLEGCTQHLVDECHSELCDNYSELLSKIDRFSPANCRIIITVKAQKPTLKQVQAIRCPTCGAGPGEKCELSTGQPRTEPHRDRRLIAAD